MFLHSVNSDEIQMVGNGVLAVVEEMSIGVEGGAGATVTEMPRDFEYVESFVNQETGSGVT